MSNTAVDIRTNRSVQLTDPRMKEQDFLRVWWVVTAQAGTTKEDIQKPEFWTQVAIKLKPYNRVDVQSDDGAFFAEYLVLSCDKTYANVKLLNWTDLHAVVEQPLEDFYPKWRGPHLKWSVIRSSDKEAIKEGFDTKDAAVAEILNLLKQENT